MFTPNVGAAVTSWWATRRCALVGRDLADEPTVTTDPSAAQRLLLSLLSEPEQRCYDAHDCFSVTGSEGGMYIVEKGYVGNVVRIRDGSRYCAHPVMNGAPVESAMVAQILAIRTDEPGFLRTAVRT